jgi:hypothetical protein
MSSRSLRNNIIGRFHGMDIPLTVDLQAFYQHILVCGATGSGKSNSTANLLKAAQTLGACCLLFDHKPDYQDLEEPNDERRAAVWGKFSQVGLLPFGLNKVEYFGLAGQEQRTIDEMQITVRASDVDPEMLAAALFPSRSEDNQRDLFLQIVDAYKASGDRIGKGKDTYTLEGIRAWIRNLAKVKEVEDADLEETEESDSRKARGKAKRGGGRVSTAAALSSKLNQSVNQATLDAMDRKIHNRKPKWLDATVPSAKGPAKRNAAQPELGLLAEVEEPTEQEHAHIRRFDFLTTLKPGRIVVLRIRAEGREYGLFLSYMLSKVNRLLSSRKIVFPVVCFIDEAHEIFRGDRAVVEAATTMTMRAINTGRSLGNGFVIATQNPSQVPPPVLNNLNTRIIHRQNEEGELKLGIPGAPHQLMRAALSFGPGEALVYIQGSRAPVRAEMAPAPFKLTKLIGPGAREFMYMQTAEQADEDTEG